MFLFIYIFELKVRLQSRETLSKQFQLFLTENSVLRKKKHVIYYCRIPQYMFILYIQLSR